MADLLEQAAEATGVPATIVARSAAARAGAEGVSTDEILARWAGVEGAPAAAPSPAPATEAPAAPAAEAPAAAPAVAAVEAEVLEPLEGAPAEEAEAPEPEPEPEPEEEPEEILVAAAGIRQLRRLTMPRWLAASFLVIPIVALFYAAAFATGANCGDAGALAVDPETGLAENCDGSEFGSAGNPLAVGVGLYAVDAVPACASCHGENGGGGTGPAFTGGAILATFPSCADHIRWVELGSTGWLAEVGDTYGANNKPVGGSGARMQGYGDSLTPEEIQAVVLFERVQFGDLDPAEAEADCGIGVAAEAAG